MPSQNQIRTELTNAILKALEDGIVPWKQSWKADKNCGLPRNAQSKRLYNGINILLLALHNYRFGFQSRHFATYRQWESLGGQVMRRPDGIPSGKWGCKIILWKPITKKNDDSEEEKTFFLMRQFTVFSIDQVKGEHLDHLRVGHSEEHVSPGVAHQQADELIANSGAIIRHGGNSAFYDPRNDFIQMPLKSQFTDNGSTYYETLMHEMCHWAEAPSRMNTRRAAKDDGYAMGELVAEMGSCFVCADLGIELAEGIDNHAAYISHWLNQIKAAVESDKSFLLRASTQASKVADYLLSFSSANTESQEAPVPA